LKLYFNLSGRKAFCLLQGFELPLFERIPPQQSSTNFLRTHLKQFCEHIFCCFVSKATKRRKSKNNGREWKATIIEEGFCISRPFWRGQNAIKWPLLTNLTERFNSSPASSAESERLFSSAGLIVNDLRKRLTQNVEKLLFLHHNLKIYNFDYAFWIRCLCLILVVYVFSSRNLNTFRFFSRVAR
jgi:hypothetical protein